MLGIGMWKTCEQGFPCTPTACGQEYLTQAEWFSAKAVIERLVKVVPASEWPWLLATYFKEDSMGLCVFFWIVRAHNSGKIKGAFVISEKVRYFYPLGTMKSTYNVRVRCSLLQAVFYYENWSLALLYTSLYFSLLSFRTATQRMLRKFLMASTLKRLQNGRGWPMLGVQHRLLHHLLVC